MNGFDDAHIKTYTGRRFYPLDPRVEDIVIEDIAHALSNQCRFSGHCRYFYSVAQHSVHVSQLCDPKDALWGLLHDATEAYLVDLPRPLKQAMGFGEGYKAAESRLMSAICENFGLDHLEPESVKIADKRILLTEGRELMTQPWGAGMSDYIGLEPYPETIYPLSPNSAEEWFLFRFKWIQNNSAILAEGAFNG